MENKLLGAALQFAKQVQDERDRKKLQSQAFTKRDQRLLRARQAETAMLPA